MDTAETIHTAIHALHLGSSVRQLTVPEAQDVVAKAEGRFIARPAARWWWEALDQRLPIATYTPEKDGYKLLPSLCPNAEAWLVASDDDDPPWPVFVGLPADLSLIVGECELFEYSVVDPRLDWLLIENHHNTFFAVGEPVAERLRRYTG